MHIDTKSLMKMIGYLTKNMVYDPDIQMVHPDYALWEFSSKSWLVTFWKRPRKVSQRITYDNYEVALTEIDADNSPDCYIPYVDWRGLTSALAIAQSYIKNQKRFIRAELYYAVNITRDNIPQWEIHFIAHDAAQYPHFVECQIDVNSSIIFDLSVSKAAKPYARTI